MSTDTPATKDDREETMKQDATDEGDTTPTSETRSNGRGTFTDKRDEKTPIDGTGYEEVENTSENEPVRLKCPYCDYSVPLGSGAERKVRQHITQSKKSKHRDRNAFQDFIHVHSIDEDGAVVDSVYSDVEWDSKTDGNGEEGDIETQMLPDSVTPGTKAAEIIQTTLANPDFAPRDVAEKMYGDRDNSYVPAVLKEHLPEEYERRLQYKNHGKRIRESRTANSPAELSEYQQRALEGVLRWPDAIQKTVQDRTNTSGGTWASLENYPEMVADVKAQVEAGELEGPPYITTLPGDEENADPEADVEHASADDRAAAVADALVSLTAKQRGMLEARVRNEFDHELTKSKKWEAAQAGVDDSSVQYLERTKGSVIETTLAAVRDGAIDGPPYVATLDGEQLITTTAAAASQAAAETVVDAAAGYPCDWCGEVFEENYLLGTHKAHKCPEKPATATTTPPESDAEPEPDAEPDVETATEPAAAEPPASTEVTPEKWANAAAATDMTRVDAPAEPVTAVPTDAVVIPATEFARFEGRMEALADRALKEAERTGREAAYRELDVLEAVLAFIEDVEDAQ